jgi:hypothetical protein
MALTPEQIAALTPTQVEEALGAHRLLEAVMKNPKTKTKAQAIIKELNPNISIPEYDIAASADEKYRELEAKFEKLQKSLADKEVDSKVGGAFERLRMERGYTPEGIEKIKGLMVEKAIADPEAAADHWDRKNPKPEISQPSGWQSTAMFDSSEGTDLDRWLKNPEKAQDEEIAAVLAEFKGR